MTEKWDLKTKPDMMNNQRESFDHIPWQQSSILGIVRELSKTAE